jgi:hypothetical protein
MKEFLCFYDRKSTSTYIYRIFKVTQNLWQWESTHFVVQPLYNITQLSKYNSKRKKTDNKQRKLRPQKTGSTYM